jgi:ComF family protein
MRALLRTAGNVIVRVFLAPVCACCQETLAHPLDHPVCPTCWLTVPRLVPPLCTWCGDMLPPGQAGYGVCARCLRAPPAFESAESAGQYAGSLRRLIHAFKYERRRMLASPLASLVRGSSAGTIEAADALIPVPLHPWRSIERGFNQADDLARCLGKPVWRVLRRRRGGPPQASLPAEERRRNVSDAFTRRFALVGGTRDLTRLRHRSVVLIDDVMTTGATLDACSRVLLEAGVRSVKAVTVARAVAKLPEPQPQRLRPLTPQR